MTTAGISKTKELRIGAYARVSSLNQVREFDSSLDTQLQHVRAFVSYKDSVAKDDPASPRWRIVQEYREEGRSGKDTDRPQLQRLLSDVRTGKLDLVVVTKIDRITRSLLDFYDLNEAFEENSVKFLAINDQFDTGTATGRAIVKLLLIFAELERERTAERTKEKVLARKQAGKWYGGHVPPGYRPAAKDHTTIEVDDAEAEIVRGIFQRYLDVPSAHALVRDLSARGIKRPKKVSRRGKVIGGKTFNIQDLTRMLSNTTPA